MSRGPFVIVFGNAKGGTGKSTLAVHFAVRLLDLGFKVGIIDCDTNQGTSCRYMINRSKASVKNLEIKCPKYAILSSSNIDGYDLSIFDQIKSEMRVKLTGDCTKDLRNVIASYSNCDFIIIDTPGTINELMLLCHLEADIVITPINNSLIDLDMIGDIDNSGNVRFGVYTEVFWEAKKKRANENKNKIEWIVLKNRLAAKTSKTEPVIDDLLTNLSKKCGFKIAPGVCERIIFRDLFRSGLTVFDNLSNSSLTQLVARSEIDAAIDVLFEILKKMMNIR